MPGSLSCPWNIRGVGAGVVDEVANPVLDSVDHLAARDELERISVGDGRTGEDGDAV